MSDADISHQAVAPPVTARVRDYIALLKPRVMSLVVFTGLVGLLIAPGDIHPVTALIALIAITAGAGASGAINMWYDADIDTVMRRTAARPIPAGRVQPEEALSFGAVIAGLSVLAMGILVNWLAAALLGLTIAFYVFVYTMWLKRRTPQNIVIGGAAGAFPPMIGWAAATGGIAVESVLMFCLTFMWTPPHFWALALFMRGDYDNAGVPMLTVTHGRKATRAHILVYTLLLAALAVAIAFTGAGGPVYLVVAVVLNALFIKGALRIWRRTEEDAEADNFAVERGFFKLSLLYLFAHFGAILVEAGLDRAGVALSLGGLL